MKPPRSASRVLSILAAALLVVAGGCVTETTRDGAATYAYAWWVAPAAVLGVGCIAAIAPLFRRRKVSPAVSAVIALLLGGLFAAEILLCWTTVGADAFTIRQGPFEGLTHVEAKYAELQAVESTRQFVPGKNGGHVDKVLVFKFKNRPSAKVDVSNPIGDLATAPLLHAAVAHGVPVVDAEGRPAAGFGPKRAESEAASSPEAAAAPAPVP